MKTSKMKECNGQVLIIVAICLPVLVGLVGLAIDAGMAYGVKAKLNAAVDAAGFAAIKNISQGDVAAEAAAEEYFYANFPDDYMGSTPVFLQANITYLSSGGVEIDVSGSANIPTTFMRVFGFDDITVGASAQVTRKSVDIAFVVDNSGSLSGVGNEVKSSAVFFVDKFDENMDRMALIKYGFGAEVPEPIETSARGFDKDEIVNDIGDFQFNSYTNSSEGFWAALNEHSRIPLVNQADLRVIVFFTDGAPNTFASEFTFNTVDNNGDPVTDNVGNPVTANGKGSIRSNDSVSPSVNEPRGLWKYDHINKKDNNGHYYGSDIYDRLLAFPDFYNTHGNTNFPVIVTVPHLPEERLVTQYTRTGNDSYDRKQLYDKVNRVSRNLLESMAKEAREEGIYVFTLGLGNRLTQGTGPDRERGEDLLRRIANVDGSATNTDGSVIIGEYCYAGDANSLYYCYDRLASAITRLAK